MVVREQGRAGGELDADEVNALEHGRAERVRLGRGVQGVDVVSWHIRADEAESVASSNLRCPRTGGEEIE